MKTNIFTIDLKYLMQTIILQIKLELIIKRWAWYLYKGFKEKSSLFTV